MVNKYVAKIIFKNEYVGLIRKDNIKKLIKDMKEDEFEMFIGENDLFDDENYFKLFKTKYKNELDTINDNRVKVNKIINDIKLLEKDSLNNFGVYTNEVEKYNTYLNTLLRKEKIKMILR